MDVIIRNSGKHFQKGKLYYKYAFYLYIALFLLSMFLPTLPDTPYKNILVALAFLAAIIAAAIGLVHMLKSYIKKEPFNKYRFFYLVGLVLLSLGPVIIVIVDISRVLK